VAKLTDAQPPVAHPTGWASGDSAELKGTDMKPIRQQIQELKHEERMEIKKCERARNQAAIWRGRERIAMNNFFAGVYAERAEKCEVMAVRAFKKSQRAIRKWVALESRTNG
jgi:ribosomal protein S2